MEGPPCGRALRIGITSPSGSEPFPLFRVGSLWRQSMGKFFLVIIAVSVAVLLAMSAYVISL
jgi:hypothetical protein